MKCLCLNIGMIMFFCLSANGIFGQLEERSWGLGMNFGLNAHKAPYVDYGLSIFLPGDFQIDGTFSAHQHESNSVKNLQKRLDEDKKLKLRIWSLGINRPIRKSNFVWTLRYMHSSFRSNATQQWYEYRDRPYEKRISVHHDINIHNLMGGVSWRPHIISKRFFFDLSFLPSLEWYQLPDRRNRSEDSRWAARQDFLRNPEHNFSLSWHFRMGFIYRIF